MRVKAVVIYDGTGYGGFQRQKNALTIQEELERALEKLTGTPTRVIAAGRTDAGVHAEGQVIVFDTEWRHPIADLHRGMNALLPEPVAVSALEQVGGDFHPRFDALQRSYRYTVYWSPQRNPLVSRTSLHVSRPLAYSAMQAAAQMLVGRHDFAAFGSPPQGSSTVREVYHAAWWIAPAAGEPVESRRLNVEDEIGPHTGPVLPDDYRWLYFDIEANAFLYRMVRIVVGTLLRVGYGSLSVEDFYEFLHTQDRRRAGPAVAARGLSLKRVVYEA